VKLSSVLIMDNIPCKNINYLTICAEGKLKFKIAKTEALAKKKIEKRKDES
jgi:hypothetical protein